MRTSRIDLKLGGVEQPDNPQGILLMLESQLPADLCPFLCRQICEGPKSLQVALLSRLSLQWIFVNIGSFIQRSPADGAARTSKQFGRGQRGFWKFECHGVLDL